MAPSVLTPCPTANANKTDGGQRCRRITSGHLSLHGNSLLNKWQGFLTPGHKTGEGGRVWVNLGWREGRSRGCAVSPSISCQSPLLFFLRQLVPIMANHNQNVAIIIKAEDPRTSSKHSICPPPFPPPFFLHNTVGQGRAREVIVRLDRKNGALQHEWSKLYCASHQQALAVLARAQKCCRWKICCHSSEASSEEWLGFSTSLASSECFPHGLGFALEGSRGKNL